jgi:hypothetical protein
MALEKGIMVFNGTFNNMSVIAFSFIGRWVENGGNGGN